MHKTNFVAVAIIYNVADQTFLLQHRDNKPEITGANQWGLFGGHGEKNETPKQTLIRELREEIGVTFSENDFVQLNDYLSIYGNNRFVFMNKSAGALPITLREGQGFAWIKADQILAYDLTIDARNDLEFFLETIVK
jgi:8-oxo-dGTP pyrophosphatase MutT (NUDIX family)